MRQTTQALNFGTLCIPDSKYRIKHEILMQSYNLSKRVLNIISVFSDLDSKLFNLSKCGSLSSQIINFKFCMFG